MTISSTSLLSFADKNPNMCFVFNVTDREFTYMNAAFKTAFQKKNKVPTLKNLFHMVHKEDKQYLKSIYSSLKHGIFKNGVEFRMVLPDRTERSFRVAILQGEQFNNNSTLTGCMEDISAFNAHDDKLNELSNKKNAILTILSHDLAGPLNSIKTFTYLLARKLPVIQDVKIQLLVTSIENLSKGCIQLIQEFIKLEFIESAGVDLIKERKDLVAILKPFMQQYIDSQDKIEKTFEFKSNKSPIYADVDESKFVQVINNLISNSIKFTTDGGEITLNLEEKKDTILITLIDNGIGIPEQYHDTLFDKFCPGRRPGLKGEPSVGLGMSTIKTIVEWHKGEIWFESEENKGTIFYIELKKSI